MSREQKSIKRILKELSPQEIVESFVLPVIQTAKEKRLADEELNECRKAREAQATEETVALNKLLKLKFQMEDAIKKD